ncbi:hypothetical protein D1007_57430 [Hordeum vulgare]|nr:hypothetical protein D1007_57430 [Hordeum vulgare]
MLNHRPQPPPRQRRRQRGTATIPISEGAPLHTRMLFEPINQTAASDETEALWPVGQGSSPCRPTPGPANFFRCCPRKGTPLPATIHVPHCKTINKNVAADANTTRECRALTIGHKIPSDPEVGKKTKLPAPLRSRLEHRRYEGRAEADYSNTVLYLPLMQRLSKHTKPILCHRQTQTYEVPAHYCC